jgi:hypothetical protein
MNCEIKTEETANERELDCRQGLTDSVSLESGPA